MSGKILPFPHPPELKVWCAECLARPEHPCTDPQTGRTVPLHEIRERSYRDLAIAYHSGRMFGRLVADAAFERALGDSRR